MWINPLGKSYADEAIATLIRDIKSADAEVEVVSVSRGEGNFHGDDVFGICAFWAAEPPDCSPVEFVPFYVCRRNKFSVHRVIDSPYFLAVSGQKSTV